jgi:tripartite motif-containing protein 71
MGKIDKINWLAAAGLGIAAVGYAYLVWRDIDPVNAAQDIASRISDKTEVLSWELGRMLNPSQMIYQQAIAATAPASKQVSYQLSFKFGTKGNGPGQFQDPHDVSFDKANNVYIPDRVRSDIQVFTHDGKYLRKFGGPGSAPGQFNVPYSARHNINDILYVCDRENNRLQVLKNDGTVITTLRGIGGKNFNKPEDLSFDPVNGDIYMTDTGNNRIVKMDKDHKFLLEWGSKGNGDSQFDHPHGIDVGADRNVYVNSGFQPYIKKFSPTGQFIKKWGSEGKSDGQFVMFLEHLDIDRRNGNVLIINNNTRPYVFAFDKEGTYLGKYGSEKEGSANGQFKEPEHVTIDSQGRAFTVDSGNFRIQVFSPTTASALYTDTRNFRYRE